MIIWYSENSHIFEVIAKRSDKSTCSFEDVCLYLNKNGVNCKLVTNYVNNVCSHGIEMSDEDLIILKLKF